MSSVASRPLLTPEEYEAIEERSEVRHEYFRGEMFAMAGASREHNLIAGNLSREIGNQLEGRPCEVYQNDMRVLVEGTGLGTYPDVVVVCGERRFTNRQATTLLNPTLIVEVLSPSTEVYDRTTKLDHYKTIESLREIVLVAQDRYRIDQYRKVEGSWTWDSITDPTGTLALGSIGCEAPLPRIYAKTEPGEQVPLRPVVEDGDRVSERA